MYVYIFIYAYIIRAHGTESDDLVAGLHREGEAKLAVIAHGGHGAIQVPRAYARLPHKTVTRKTVRYKTVIHKTVTFRPVTYKTVD